MQENQEKRRRSLTDEDIEALADALEHRIIGRFYNNLGQGVFALLWKGFVTIIVGIAAYGAIQGWWNK